MKVVDLARCAILDALSGPELVVYLRLIAETRRQSSRRVAVRNIDLYRNTKTAITALRSLENQGLIKLTYDGSSSLQRTVEVIR